MIIFFQQQMLVTGAQHTDEPVTVFFHARGPESPVLQPAHCELVLRPPHPNQTLPVCPKAFDPDGRAMRAAIEEELWASHLALRAAGEPDSVSRRALCKAVHLSPSSVRSWIRLGTVVADAAVSRHSTLPFTSPSSTRECAEHKVPAELAHACLTVGKEQAKLKILNKNRDTHKGGSIAHGGSGADDTAMGVDITAADYAKGLCGLAKANLCGGKPGSSSQAAKTAARAVHMYPGAGSTWRCLAAALVRIEQPDLVLKHSREWEVCLFGVCHKVSRMTEQSARRMRPQ